jgi:hypothetical protein
MGPKLLTKTAWTRLGELARRKRRPPAEVAVPYLGRGAAKRLRLRKGDVLVTRFDDVAFKCGLVDPREVVRYLRRGVEVHAASNLHAKVFVFGNTAIVGSTNVSTHSAERLIEAACESRDSRFVASSAQFVRSLRGELIGLEFAKSKVPLYKPPTVPARTVGRRRGRQPVQSPLIAVGLVRMPYDADDARAARSGAKAARARIKNRSQFRVADFKWSRTLGPLRKDVRIIQTIREGENRFVVEPPARILSIHKYKGRRAIQAIVFVEEPTKRHAKPLSAIVRSVPGASMLGRVRSCREIRDPDLTFKLGKVWG